MSTPNRASLNEVREDFEIWHPDGCSSFEVLLILELRKLVSAVQALEPAVRYS